MTITQNVPQMQSKFKPGQSNKPVKGKFDDYQIITVESLDLRDEEVERNPKPTKSKIEEAKLFDDFDSRSIRIRKMLLIDFKEKLIKLLKKYHECFNQAITNMPRIDPEVAYHKLAIDLIIKLMHQKKSCHGLK